MKTETRIRPWTDNPRYWQYKGEPVLLLGGTYEDNLFQKNDLKEHLDLLKSLGGNYIRNVMSGRDDGDVWMYAQNKDGRYDLDTWNPEFWDRFEKMLQLTAEREIVVQIEVWAFHDFNGKVYGSTWERNPYRPSMNVNYDEAETTLKNAPYDIGVTKHPFFCTVPALNNDTKILTYQQRFVDKLLSYSLEYGHILYCMTNEIHPHFSPEWGWYWSEYIQRKAAAAGTVAETTEMFWQPDVTHEQHRASLDRPEIYSYFEASQNSATRTPQHRDNLEFMYDYLSEAPRPVNHTKIYGADGGWKGDSTAAAIGRFWRNILGGSASSRFHRPEIGLGLSEPAQNSIRSMRLFLETFDILQATPHNELLQADENRRCCVSARPGKQYAVYIAPGDTVKIDLTRNADVRTARWLDITNSVWTRQETVSGGTAISLQPEYSGHWVIIIE